MAELPRRSLPAQRTNSGFDFDAAQPALVGGRATVTWEPLEEEKRSELSGLTAAPSCGSRVLVGSSQLRATVRFVGPTSFASGLWVGVELDVAQGRNDGSVKGVRYFDCPLQHGLFVRVHAVSQDGEQNGENAGGSASFHRRDSSVSMGSEAAGEEHDEDGDDAEVPFEGAPTLDTNLAFSDEEDVVDVPAARSLKSRHTVGAAGDAGKRSLNLVELVAAEKKQGAAHWGRVRSTVHGDELANVAVPRLPRGSTPDAPRSSLTSSRRKPRNLSNEPFKGANLSVPLASTAGAKLQSTRSASPRAVGHTASAAPDPDDPVQDLRSSDMPNGQGYGHESPLSRQQSLDLTGYRAQAVSSSPRPVEPDAPSQDALRKDSLQWRKQRRGSPADLRAPRGPAPPPGCSIASPLNAVAAIASSPVSDVEPEQTPACWGSGGGAATSSTKHSAQEKRWQAQTALAQAVEEHDAALIRKLLPHACKLGLDASELESAQNILQFEVGRSLLYEIDDVRSAVASLVDTVQAAEKRAVAAERILEMQSERNWSRGPASLPTSSAAGVCQDDAWLVRIVDTLERKVWETLDVRVEDFRSDVAQAASDLMIAVAEIRKLSGSLSASTSLPPKCEQGSAERAEEIRILGEALASGPAEPTSNQRGSTNISIFSEGEDERTAAHIIQSAERGRRARRLTRNMREDRLHEARKTLELGGYSELTKLKMERGCLEEAATLDSRSFAEEQLEQALTIDETQLASSAPGAEDPTRDFFEFVAEECDVKLGFQPSALPPGQIFISKIEPDSWSSRKGLQEDDELVTVGSMSVSQIGEEDFCWKMRERPLRLAFVRIVAPTPSATSVTPNDCREASPGNKFAASTSPGSPLDAQTVELTPRCDDPDAPPSPMKVRLRPPKEDHKLARRHSNPLLEEHRSSDHPVRRHSNPLLADQALSPAGYAKPSPTSPATTEASLASTFGSPARIGRSPRGTRVGSLGSLGGCLRQASESRGSTPKSSDRTGFREMVAEDGRAFIDLRLRSPFGVDEVRSNSGRSPMGRSPRSPARSPAEFLASILPPISPNTPSPYTPDTPTVAGAALPPLPPSSIELPSCQSDAALQGDWSGYTASGGRLLGKVRSAAPLSQEASLIQVVATEEDSRLGFKPSAMPPERIFVEEVEPGSWSDLHGISRGDELVACNGEPVAEILPHMLVDKMKMRPLQLSFAHVTGRNETSPAQGKMTSSSDTVLRSAMPDTESSVSFVEDSYLYTPSAPASSSKSRASLTFQSESASPAWTAHQRQRTAIAPHAALDASNASTPGAKELSDSLRAALFAEEPSEEFALSNGWELRVPNDQATARDTVACDLVSNSTVPMPLVKELRTDSVKFGKADMEAKDKSADSLRFSHGSGQPESRSLRLVSEQTDSATPNTGGTAATSRVNSGRQEPLPHSPSESEPNDDEDEEEMKF